MQDSCEGSLSFWEVCVCVCARVCGGLRGVGETNGREEDEVTAGKMGDERTGIRIGDEKIEKRGEEIGGGGRNNIQMRFEGLRRTFLIHADMEVLLKN